MLTEYYCNDVVMDEETTDLCPMCLALNCEAPCPGVFQTPCCAVKLCQLCADFISVVWTSSVRSVVTCECECECNDKCNRKALLLPPCVNCLIGPVKVQICTKCNVIQECSSYGQQRLCMVYQDTHVNDSVDLFFRKICDV